MKLETVRARRDFLAANRGKRVATPGFVLLVHDRADADDAMRVGYTVSRKVGNAVVRNRMKRQFREIMREMLPQYGHVGCDHILIGRLAGVGRSFDLMRGEMMSALKRAAQ